MTFVMLLTAVVSTVLGIYLGVKLEQMAQQKRLEQWHKKGPSQRNPRRQRVS